MFVDYRVRQRMNKLVLLHTAAVHIDTFENLHAVSKQNIQLIHRVREDLLSEARRLGADHVDIRRILKEVIEHEFRNGAQTLLCTCSTIGGVAEVVSKELGYPVLRVDRAMAEKAVDLGGRITVAAALESTLQPTTELLLSVAIERSRKVEIKSHLDTEAWHLFVAGELDAYARRIAQGLDAITGTDVIVLAQASMAKAVEFCKTQQKPILSSPELGFNAAIKLCLLNH